MKYTKQIDPELRRIAKSIPYNKAIIPFANLFQRISFSMTAVPGGITHRHIVITGYKGLRLSVHIFEPSGIKEKLPCLIYAHGGAFSYRAAAYHKKLACIYARGSKCRVYFPDYHLTPAYPYPAAYHDVLALYKHIIKNSEEFGIDSARIGLAGDSAGASLAALLCGNYARESLLLPCLQMLVYPVTDMTMETDSMKRFPDTPLWNAENNRRMWSYYLRGVKAEDVWGASPMHIPLPQTIPDTYIETAEYDCLHDEGLLYGNRLREAGANVEINETRGTFHGYDLALHTGAAVRNIEKRISFLTNRFWPARDDSDISR